MSETNYPYFCSHCHSAIVDASEVLLIESSIARPFCSEKCIVDFHSKFVDFFEEKELRLREKLNLINKEDYQFLLDENDELSKNLLTQADEIWLDTSELGEHYYHLIKTINYQGSSLYLLGTALFYHERPSMLLFHTVTSFESLVNEFRKDENIKNKKNQPSTQSASPSEADTPKKEVTIPDEVIQALEKKKSEYLADFLTFRSKQDINLEDFTKYEKYTGMVLNDPDEIFEYIDADNDQILTYIKSFIQKEGPFFYIVVCLKVDEDLKSNEDVLIPIITFPSTDGELYKKYKLGERISGGLKN